MGGYIVLSRCFGHVYSHSCYEIADNTERASSLYRNGQDGSRGPSKEIKALINYRTMLFRFFDVGKVNRKQCLAVVYKGLINSITFIEILMATYF